jgi:hypothetical protein
MLYKETVKGELWNLLQMLMKDEKLKDFNLVGGTALALRLGHRMSVDIDLFTTKDFNSEMMLKYLQEKYETKLIEGGLSNNTILTFIGDIKVDLLAHKYPLLSPIEINDGIRLISNQDIGAMKLHAIHQSGERYKDFVDMYFLLEQKPLKFYLQAYQSKYNKDPYWAVIGLLTYDKIVSLKGIDLLDGKQSDFKQVKNRLEQSVKNPSQKFRSERNGLPFNLKKKRGFRR